MKTAAGQSLGAKRGPGSSRARRRGRLAGQVSETVLRGLAAVRVRLGAFVREVLAESALGIREPLGHA
eukprot:6490678-Alexandrium_andersonii.AAC.1